MSEPNGGKMKATYVCDAKDVIKRIRMNHCSGNIEASALRKSIAKEKGYPIKKKRRPSGSLCVRLNIPDPQKGEQEISAYLKEGVWKFVFCNSYKEAQDFQWYAIEMLAPRLNTDRRPSNMQRLKRYKLLLAELSNASSLSCDQLKKVMKSGAGVYVFYHQAIPEI